MKTPKQRKEWIDKNVIVCKSKGVYYDPKTGKTGGSEMIGGCARGDRSYLEWEHDIKLKGVASAKDFGGVCLQMKFYNAIYDKSVPFNKQNLLLNYHLMNDLKHGDIVIFGAYTKDGILHKHGHVAIAVEIEDEKGNLKIVWISDFVQMDVFGGSLRDLFAKNDPARPTVSVWSLIN